MLIQSYTTLATRLDQYQVLDDLYPQEIHRGELHCNKRDTTSYPCDKISDNSIKLRLRQGLRLIKLELPPPSSGGAGISTTIHIIDTAHPLYYILNYKSQ
jgi:hypothetical protein